VDNFIEKGCTDAQAKLKAVWTNPNIASICSQMPNITILMSNVAAALDKTKLTAGDLRLLEQYARETAANYCAGCSNICEKALAGAVPVATVMRYLMYYESYGNRHRARSFYGQLSSQVRARIGSLDYSLAERRCPQGMAIGKLMKRAEQLLA
jgi:predicted aldo/keto reductase-like oxidoreductase